MTLPPRGKVKPLPKRSVRAVPRTLPHKPLRYIDLFAGCGGLSLGLEKAGPTSLGFELVLAVEKSDMAAETFFHNFIQRIESPATWDAHLHLPVREQAKRGLVVKELKAVLDDRELLESLHQQDIDLVAGGPPCQGFSMAGRRDPADIRNELPWQFLDFVAAVAPRAVLIENVVGISLDFDKHGEPAPFLQLGMQLEQTGPGYVVQRMRLNAQDYGVPQHRPRMVLVGLRRDIAAARGITSTDEVWRSDADLVAPALAPTPTFRGDPRTVADALWDLRQGYVAGSSAPAYQASAGKYARMMRSDRKWFPPASLAAKEQSPLEPANNKQAQHSDKTTRRFRLYQYLDQFGISPRVLTVERGSAQFAEVEDEIRSRLKEAAKSGAVFPWTMPAGTTLAKSSRDVVNLVDELHTKKHSQRSLRGTRPSPTVLTLPDDLVHYEEPRIHTVRELARLQSFPDTFVFRAKETTGSSRRRVEVPQYTQVGNAVPPLLAKAIGDKLFELLSRVEAPPPRRRP